MTVYQFNARNMKKGFALILAVCALVVSSCASSRFFSQKASQIRPIALVEPYAYITDAVGDWSTEYLDKASVANQTIVAEIVTSMGLPIEKTLPVEYHNQQSAQTDAWMRRLGEIGPSAAKQLEIPVPIRAAVNESGCRYGLVITDLGYLKNPDEYAIEKAIDTGTRVMDAIANNEIDLSSDAEAFLNGVFALVFDSQTGEVVWYGAQPRRYKKSPIDPQTLSQQLQALFKDFK